MLIKGSIGSKKLKLQAQKYIEWIKSGAQAHEILAVVLNPYKKAVFINEIKAQAPEIKSEKSIYTFSGLCSNAFLDCKDFILKSQHGGQIDANLCGLEISQYIFKESIKTADFSDYISKVNLLHQLFRRYSLIVHNCLSNKEVMKRSISAGESFAPDAEKALDDYKLKTFKYSSFDYLRQLAVLPVIYKNTDYFKNVKYFLADDADEFSYAFFQFLERLMPQLKEYSISYDEYGSSRAGYLCAYKSGISDFIKEYKPEIFTAESISAFEKLSIKLYNSVKKGEKYKTSELKHFSGVKRLDMLQKAIEQIKSLIKKGVKEEEISIITPLQDEVLKACFEAEKIKLQILSGSGKLSDDEAVKMIIISLKLISGAEIFSYEFKNVLFKLLKIPYQKAAGLLMQFDKEKTLKPFDFGAEKYNYAYTKYISLIQNLKQSKNSLTEQIKILGENLLKEFNIEYSKRSYEFLLKEALSFEKAFNGHIENIAREFAVQMENSIISENPADAAEILKGKVISSVPQKIIDYAYKTKYMLILDISSAEWIKNDTGTLYNAWVLSRDWHKETFTMEDNAELSNAKTAAVLRKLLLCAEKEIMLFSSLYDNTGNENTGGISKFIEIEENGGKNPFKIVPRRDQKPVLEYRGGRLGITAVPGAGKTTILLALILKLMEEGAEPENIFVLTYMESAAKNFKERIKAAAPDNSHLPNISTIHGLALRIIKENGNYTKAGLDENFEICDDNMKEIITRGLFFKLKIDEEKYDNYIKCISEIKSCGAEKELRSKYREIQEFFNFYREYNKYLRENNLIDYDDMLYFAVKILEENEEIRRYYQNLCRYIIEDEAQDSTHVQQKLSGILSAKYNNLVRCGDINQSITSTFTNSDPEGFKNFILNNKKIEMTSSGRCSKPVYTLANEFIKEASKASKASKTFYPAVMQDAGNNPACVHKPEYVIFKTESAEKSFILNKIKEIKADNPDASIAVLLRLNAQAEEYAAMLEAADIKTASETGCPADKLIFKVIFSLLKIMQNPLNNSFAADFAQALKLKKNYSITSEDINFITALKTPFIFSNPDELNSEGLLQLYFDISYFINSSIKPYDITAFDAGVYYAADDAEKSNAYMISSLIKKLNTPEGRLNELIEKLEYASKKNSSFCSFFDAENLDKTAVKIMTMHKSKGAEFDYVFIPELNEENYPSSAGSVKLKSGGHFVQTVKNIVSGVKAKTPEELKQETADENLRLLYVGITRAKRGLFFTNAENYRRRKNTKPAEILQKICIG